MSGIEQVGHVIARHLDHAEAGQRTGDVGFGIGHRYPPVQLHGVHVAACIDEFPALALAGSDAAEVHGRKAREAGRIDGHCMPGQQGRAGAIDLDEAA